MDKNPPKKARQRSNRQIMGLTLILLGVLALLIYFHHKETNRRDLYNKKAIKLSLETYELIKTTELSDTLHDRLVEIIQARKDCSAIQVSYDERNSRCRKAYINEIFQLARANIKSAPMPGLFIRTIRECPIAGSLCNGEVGRSEAECIEMEVRCIEYCLDQYWRGGTFPDENNYTYGKSKE